MVVVMMRNGEVFNRLSGEELFDLSDRRPRHIVICGRFHYENMILKTDGEDVIATGIHRVDGVAVFCKWLRGWSRSVLLKANGQLEIIVGKRGIENNVADLQIVHQLAAAFIEAA